MSSEPLGVAPERILSTLNKDGSRRSLFPSLAQGRFYYYRLVLAWTLILLFVGIPHLTMNGLPMMLFDLPTRHFYLFGAVFLATDTLLFMLFMVGLLLSIFLLTALLGRVWCGWGCPQIVYMEFIFRPLERLIEGHSAKRGGEKTSVHPLRRVLKYLVFLGVAFILANSFLAYWVGADAVMSWMFISPAEHITSFIVMLVTTFMVFMDFAWFREQTCLVACPYGRFQSVLLDQNSLIVAYDTNRGEPRGHLKKSEEGNLGDCIDCDQCVKVCPTGIDIREGLQMECVHCTQCIDACDAVMEKVKRPLGLIRYATQAELEGTKTSGIRSRLLFYPALLVLVFGLLIYQLNTRETADLTILRGLGTPWAEVGGERISNALRLKVTNRDQTNHSYHIELLEPASAELIAPQNPLPVGVDEMKITAIFVITPTVDINTETQAVFKITDQMGFEQEISCRLLGP